MLLAQILIVLVLAGLITLAVLVIIEPGPIQHRSRQRPGSKPAPPGDETEGQG
jgi:hypothetical protein